MRLICLGDSLTFGFGVSPAQRWTRLVGQETDWQVLNYGVNGDTTTGMLVRMQTLMQSGVLKQTTSDPYQILIMGGSNDIFYSGSDICARSSLGAMIHQLASIGTIPIVGIPIPVDAAAAPASWGAAVNFEQAAEQLEDYCYWLQRYCKGFGLNTIDFRSDFLSQSGLLRRELFLDGLHPTPAGHRMMADRVKEALGKIH